jgi:hypothetical protein
MIANVLVQVALSHLWRRRKPGAAIGCGALSGLAVAAGIAASAPAFPAVERVSWSVLTYLGLAFGYWAFLNLNLTSLRIRVLKEIFAAPGEALSRATLAQRYDDCEMAERRLARLEAAGQVVRLGERYVLKAQWLVRIARFISLLREAIIPEPVTRDASSSGSPGESH